MEGNLEQAKIACPYCLEVEPPVYVHGHYQCVTCHTNIDPCCQGEQCPAEYWEDLGDREVSKSSD